MTELEFSCQQESCYAILYSVNARESCVYLDVFLCEQDGYLDVFACKQDKRERKMRGKHVY